MYEFPISEKHRVELIRQIYSRCGADTGDKFVSLEINSQILTLFEATGLLSCSDEDIQVFMTTSAAFMYRIRKTFDIM